MYDIFLMIIMAFLIYIFSSIPFGLLIGKRFKQKDLRLLGSQNIGASNAVRVLGFKYGLLIFILDFLKGFLPIIIVSFLDINGNYYRGFIRKHIIILGLAAILGHMFSVFNKFKGGKAIATSVGLITGINPVIGVLGVLFFVILVLWKGYASLASLISTLLVNILLFNDFFLCCNNIDITNYDKILIFFITIIVFLKHYNNIINLIKGAENKFK
ncbi:acyl-phosphate glycerol 3-phosphate acyltransferase [Candidatus Phytoplasma phoenicium]|uniref:Glycerol-3-phosphate acyltransferase n=1 Tax=Candidatus Phytoplasma phoenicium TaxID=198422 RepID=A0A2S8NVQ1_9MOLU|nr:acyl-phosphate glycerol 3-phosphate acyltransferase [Candidatus Phytoplasma phoenicium]